MSAPLNFYVSISSTSAATSISDDKTKSKKQPIELAPDELASFAVVTARQNPQNYTSMSKLNNATPPETQPTPANINNMIQSASSSSGTSKILPSPELKKLAETFKSVCEHGLLTQMRAEALGKVTNVSMDVNPNRSSISLNYIFNEDGVGVSLKHEAKGGLSVALERKMIR